MAFEASTYSLSVFVVLAGVLFPLEFFLLRAVAAIVWILPVSLAAWPWVVTVWVAAEANEISAALGTVLLAALFAVEAFLDLLTAVEARELADSLATGVWIVGVVTGRFRACNGGFSCVVASSLPVRDTLGVTLIVLAFWV
jgi:signal transduction histidine kinase